MTLHEATQQGIRRVRRPCWAFPDAYLLLDLIATDNGWRRGPWVHLYERRCQESINAPTPQHLLALQDDTADYVAYTGELDRADKSEP
jgi:hypothetical protein